VAYGFCLDPASNLSNVTSQNRALAIFVTVDLTYNISYLISRHVNGLSLYQISYSSSNDSLYGVRF
jgi:hypothetical protein